MLKSFRNMYSCADKMAPPIRMLSEVNPQTQNYAVQVMILEKAMPRAMVSTGSHYQRLLFQDVQVSQSLLLNN